MSVYDETKFPPFVVPESFIHAGCGEEAQHKKPIDDTGEDAQETTAGHGCGRCC